MPHQELYDKIFAEKAGGLNKKEFLQQICNEYPYFSLAHFFLLKESSPSDFNYRKIAGKTALHFNNPFLLRYQLNRKIRTEEVEGVNKVDGVEDIDEVDRVDKVDRVNEVEKVDKAEGIDEFERSNDVDEVRLATDKEEKIDTVTELFPPAGSLRNEITTAKANATDEKEELLFEPLHTTDYFASQGIKLSEEVQPGDKLGKQLRSFTDWLKTMKKVHHGKLPEAAPAVDLAVQNLAEKSNKEDEILTESMAEVYLQQGKKEKALDIYQKLSLLNPAKSAYFAAKIELLK